MESRSRRYISAGQSVFDLLPPDISQQLADVKQELTETCVAADCEVKSEREDEFTDQSGLFFGGNNIFSRNIDDQWADVKRELSDPSVTVKINVGIGVSPKKEIKERPISGTLPVPTALFHSPKEEWPQKHKQPGKPRSSVETEELVRSLLQTEPLYLEPGLSLDGFRYVSYGLSHASEQLTDKKVAMPVGIGELPAGCPLSTSTSSIFPPLPVSNVRCDPLKRESPDKQAVKRRRSIRTEELVSPVENRNRAPCTPTLKRKYRPRVMPDELSRALVQLMDKKGALPIGELPADCPLETVTPAGDGKKAWEKQVSTASTNCYSSEKNDEEGSTEDLSLAGRKTRAVYYVCPECGKKMRLHSMYTHLRSTHRYDPDDMARFRAQKRVQD